MEEERFISGYCKQSDCSRMVAVVISGGIIEEADCCYGSCIYQPNCPIAGEIEKLKK